MNVFLDTNVIVYAFDKAEPKKRKVALRILDDESASYAVSAQVLNEFYVTVTRKLKVRLSQDAARAAVEELSKLRVVPIDKSLVLSAIDLAAMNDLSLWDASVIEAARLAGCSTVLTEDLNDGQAIGSVRIKNPFSEVT